MKRKPDPELVDEESPEWTDSDFARALRFDQLPKEHQAALASVRRRGPQRAPTKTSITLRLSAEVVEHYRATGPGWQTRIDETLRGVIAAKPPRKTAKASPSRRARR